MQETQVQSLGREDPFEKEMATTLVFLPEKSHGQKSLVGYSPWGHRVRYNLATKPLPPNTTIRLIEKINQQKIIG